MSVPFLPYAKQSIQEEDCQAVAAALNKNLVTGGLSSNSLRNRLQPIVKSLMRSHSAAGRLPWRPLILPPAYAQATV